MKKALSIFLALLLIASFSICAFAENEPLNYLLLGDSITEGFGVKNPYDASYGKIVADSNGYSYKNLAMMARDSERQLLYLTDTSYSLTNTTISAVRQADIISLSIGANDYLANDDVVKIAAGALFKLNDRKLDEIADNYYINLCKIIEKIREYNPTVVILLQKVYYAWTGFAGNAFTACAARVNKTIEKFDAEHPGQVTVVDIAPAINGHPENLADDCVHPNAKGNIEISKIILNKLYEMGLGTETEPVIIVEGINYNFFGDDFKGWLLSALIKLLTGNSQNIFRKN